MVRCFSNRNYKTQNCNRKILQILQKFFVNYKKIQKLFKKYLEIYTKNFIIKK